MNDDISLKVKPSTTLNGKARRMEGEREGNGRLQRPSKKAGRGFAAVGETYAYNPLDAAFMGNWIALEDFSAARAYLVLYRQTAPRDGPRLGRASLPEADREMNELRGRSLTASEIVTLWNRIVEAKSADPEAAELRAELQAAKWRIVNNAMTDAERAEVRAVCINEEWPAWLLRRCAGEALRAKAIAENRGLSDAELAEIAAKFGPEPGRKLLVSGLRSVAATLKQRETARRSPPADPMQRRGFAAPETRRPMGTVIAEFEEHVDEDGVLMFTVERRRAR